MANVSRRNLLTAAAATITGAATAPRAAAAAAADQHVDDYHVLDQSPFNGQTRRLKLTNGDRYITSLIFATDYPTHFRLKPEFYPVCTPRGIPVTDSHQYCFIHHQSVMCGHGKVQVEGSERNVDFFRKLPFPDPQRKDRWHRGFNLFDMGPSGIQRITDARWTVGERIMLRLTLHWQTRQMHHEVGETLIVEQRQYDVMQRGPATIIDQYSRLTAAERPVTLLADLHSFAGVRVHDLIDVEDGGTMKDSEGRVNPEGKYWGQEPERRAPRWVDCSGKVGESTVGMTLMGHPANVRNQFYVRHYGILIVSATLGDDVYLTRREPFVFAARFVAHDGPLEQQSAEAWYREFAARPLP